MTALRESFEAWWTEHAPIAYGPIFLTPSELACRKAAAWDGWRNSTAAALAEAQKTADEIYEDRGRVINELARAKANLSAQEAENRRLREALEFYADPFNRKDDAGDPIAVPDFYSELNFGDRASKALSLPLTIPHSARGGTMTLLTARDVATR